MFTRVTPLIVYLQVVVLLVITNYYLNPLVLNSNCLTGNRPPIQATHPPSRWETDPSSTAPPASTWIREISWSPDFQEISISYFHYHYRSIRVKMFVYQWMPEKQRVVELLRRQQ